MEISEIRVFLKEGQDKKLKAYTTVTFDQVFVVRNIKVIEGANGLFIAMPSRKMKGNCLKCNFKNEVGSKFCNQCGASLPAHVPVHLTQDDDAGHSHDVKSDHRDIAHPVTQKFREYLQGKILEAYKTEIEKKSSPSPS